MNNTQAQQIAMLKAKSQMPSKTYGHDEVMSLLDYLSSLEKRNLEMAEAIERLKQHAVIQDQTNRIAIERLCGNVAQLSEELREARSSREEAADYIKEQVNGFDHESRQLYLFAINHYGINLPQLQK